MHIYTVPVQSCSNYVTSKHNYDFFFRSLKRVVSEEAEEELSPHKLPGELNDWTGNVLYPDEESRKWDVNG